MSETEATSIYPRYIQPRVLAALADTPVVLLSGPRHACLLEILILHLHVALARAFKGANRPTPLPLKILPGLTDRENEILHWMDSGKANREISQVLKISENTVKNHVQHILIKLKVNTRAQAVSKITGTSDFPS